MEEISVLWPPSGAPLPNHWRLEDIPLHDVQAERIRDNKHVFYLIVSASFVESMTFCYTENLIHHLRDNPAAVEWLRDRWQREETQHGHALRRYAEAVWPELDWPAGYEFFYREYSGLCTLETLEPSPGLEMLARMVVEVGTATYYTMLGHLSDEPVLRLLTEHIAQDEVRHYTYFHRFFRAYHEIERFGRGTRARVMLRRLLAIEHEDADIALRAIQHSLPVGHRFRTEPWADTYSAILTAGKVEYPYRMAVTMLLKPLELPATIRRALAPLLETSARALMFSHPRTGSRRAGQAPPNLAA